MDEKKGAPEKIKNWFQRDKSFQEIQEHVKKDGLVGFAEKQAKSMDRRKFMSTMAMTAGGLPGNPRHDGHRLHNADD